MKIRSGRFLSASSLFPSPTPVRIFRARIVLVTICALGFSGAIASTLLDAVEAYFKAGTSAQASIICSAGAPASASELTAALESALRKYEELEYAYPSNRRPASFEAASRCLWVLSERATPRGMVYGAFFAIEVNERLERFKKAAQLGDPDAMWRYAGELSQTPPSEGLPQHFEFWRKSAAIAGHPEAQNSLAGSLVRQARDLEARASTSATTDPRVASLHREALGWYESFAWNSNTSGSSCSGVVAPRTFFRDVAKCSSPFSRGTAMAIAAKYYFDGKYGIAQDFERAASHFKNAIALDVYLYGLLYAEILENGLAGVPDQKAAETMREKTDAYYKKLLKPIY